MHIQLNYSSGEIYSEIPLEEAIFVVVESYATQVPKKKKN